jgi:hypothetical protein
MDRREFLKSSSAATFGLGMSAELLVQPTHAQAASEDDSQEDPSSNVALQFARMLNQTKYADLPPKAIEYAKVTSTIASAAFGSNIGSARIVRELAKEHGGKPESMIWFDGAKAPANEVARVNAI